MNIQEKYWKYMVQIKSWEFYLDLYAEQSYKRERTLNGLLAIVSSASVAGWAIWNKYSFIWGVIIAVSQVITAIKPLLPFSKRIEIVSQVLPAIVDIFNRMDKDWFNVASGSLTEKEINDLLYEYKSTYSSIERKNMKTPVLLNKESILQKSDEMTNDYFENY